MGEVSKDERFNAYMEAIRRRVCAVCLDQRDDGTCRLAGGRVCAIEAHMPHVVTAILGIRSNRMDEYVQAIRAQICGDCKQDLDGYCTYRDKGECALWTYLPLVVDAIEEVSGVPVEGRDAT